MISISISIFTREIILKRMTVQCSAPGHRQVFRNPGTRQVQVNIHPRAGLAKECPAAPSTGHIPTSLVVTRFKALLPLPDFNNL